MINSLLILIFYIVEIFTAILASTFLSVLVHELGHAIPMLFLARHKVEIYIGSIGSVQSSGRLKLGRLAIFVTYNPFLWVRGMCKPGGSFTINQQILYVITGPVASVLLAIFSYELLHITEGLVFTRWCLGIILFFSCSIIISGIIPTRVKRSNSSIKGNDGYRIVQLLKSKALTKEINTITTLVQNGKMEEAVQLFENKLQGQKKSEHVFRLGIWMYMHAKDYHNAVKLDKQFANTTKYRLHDIAQSGYIDTIVGNYQSAISKYHQVLASEEDYIHALTGISYSMALMGDYTGEIEYANRSLALNPKCAASLDNRGLARLKTGLLEHGKADLEESISIDDKQAETYRNLGLYYLLKKEFSEALRLFEKSKEMNNAPNDIDEYINEAKIGCAEKDFH